jgi:Domain of unknown function (DUF6429)
MLALLNAPDAIVLLVPGLIGLDPDPQKIEDAVLALLLLGFHNRVRVWKSHDWNTLDRLFKKGLITDPARRSYSVALTDAGLAEAERLFAKLFTR